MSRDGSEHDIAVLGCGNMGSAITRAAVGAGHRTIVWNRTAARADALQESGATAAPTVPEAVESAPLVVVSVSGTGQVQQVLEAAGDAVRGRTVLNLTSGTADDAAALAEWAASHGASYLDGAVLAYPEQIGSPDARIVVAGEEELWRRHSHFVRDLAGASTHVGRQPAAANVLDTGLTGVFYFSGVLAFVEAVRFLKASGVSEGAVTELVDHYTDQLGWLMRDILRRTASDDYVADQASLAVYAESAETFLAAVRTKSPAPLLSAASNLLAQGVAAGLGGSDVAVLTSLPADAATA